MFSWLKMIFCKHEYFIWLKPSSAFTGTVKYPAKVCQDCNKLTWVNQEGSKIINKKPIKIFSSKEITVLNWLKKSSKWKAEPEKESSQCRVEKTPKNISEPIFAIARSFKENPSRWKVEKKEEGESYFKNKIFDIKTKEKFLTKFYTYLQFQEREENYLWYMPLTETICKRKIDCDWITEDESDYLIEEFDKMMIVKTNRLKSIKQIRKNKERQRLMEIYK